MTPDASDSASAPRPNRTDLWMMVLLALVCLMLRLPTLDRVALNPDESQFESSAAYLAATGHSAFQFPYGTPWTMTLYKGIAVIFGPYSMPEMRILVLLIALATAWILYDMVGREAGPGWGLLAGLLFLHVNQAFEGWTANREWFSFFPALAGIYLATLASRDPTRRRWALWVSAGLVCGTSLWFKRQASFLVLVVPTVLLWQAWVERDLRTRLRQLAPFAAGGLLAGALFLLPFLIHGTADVYVGSLFADYTQFVGENEAQMQDQAGGALVLYAGKLFWNLPFRALFLLAYAFAAVVLVSAVRRGLRGGTDAAGAARPGLVLFAVYLVAALACVKLGNRFFGHYYLYAIAPLSGAVALAAHRLGRLADTPVARGIALTVAGLFVVDRVLGLGVNSWADYRAAGAESIVYLVYAVVGLAILGFGLARPWRRAGAMLAALVLLESTLVLVQEQRRPVPPSFPYHADAFRSLAAKVTEDAREDDRIFVWGWIPEVYSATRLEPASHMTITEYVIDDYYVTAQEPTINRPMADLLMEDLVERRPRFIVDATARSWTMVAGGDPWLYRLDLYPDFELGRMLREEYRRVGRFSDCDLYERREDRPAPALPSS